MLMTFQVFAFEDDVVAVGFGETTGYSDRNDQDVAPSISQVDNKDEKFLKFSWGTLFYKSVTKTVEEKTPNEPQTMLNMRYTCNDGTVKTLPPQQFCGYATSVLDLPTMYKTMGELKLMPEHRGKTDKEFLELYHSQYNDLVADPALNISDKTSAYKTPTIEITVLSRQGEFGACEKKVTAIPFTILCR